MADEEAKALGNAAFSSGDFPTAILHYTTAISLSPTNHLLFSNRSAAHASLRNYTDALSDAKKTVELKPDWSKGYISLGAAHLGLNHFKEAVAAYHKGLQIDPSNEALRSGLADARDSAIREAFKGEEMWTKLRLDPSTRGFLKQPDYVKMTQEIQKNPRNLSSYVNDQRVRQSVGVLLNFKGRGDKKEKKQEMKERAETEKILGTTAFKNSEFEAAIQHYSKAIEFDDEDISYITNRAAVYLQIEKYNECIEDCDKAVERGSELGSDYNKIMVARALTRKGTAFTKMAKCSKDYDPAFEAYQRALTVHRNSETSSKLHQAESAKKEWERQEYIDPKIGDEEREKGNELFNKKKYPDAIKQYTEAIKRNPKDHKAYSNRAACYVKLRAMPNGLEDAEKCIEIEPKFSGGYFIKAEVEFYLNEYDNAMKTYLEGLKHDPNNQELLDGVTSCIQKVNEAKRGGLTPEELKEKRAKGMEDPEIQSILTDPVIRQVMSDLEENPSAAKKQMENTEIMSKIQKLISARIVQMK
ncbi:unnamed protein product [Eruca vesicaria subsp. sativa]|uniref:STI1 domain-containing protein n=1 Tax=Eruca vesicaria subsp. sativa TaxID=29727 RepID=A0ABC8LFG6_ERUVS|nr:unnamed protein product [Eruca vesicaria subsp. sativa]